MSSPLPVRDFPSEEELRPKVDPVTGLDLSLIEENLKLIPGARMQAHDDAVISFTLLAASGQPGLHDDFFQFVILAV
jgi:hypothetical protein